MTTPVHVPTSARRRWKILIPVIITIYIIAYIDRVNIGFGMEGIRESLNMDASQAGFAAGIFFIGYLVLQVPGGYLAQKWSARKVVFVLMIGWGVCAILAGFVHSYTQLLIARFTLGVFEGGVQPALMVLISRWFSKAERGRAFSLFIMHNPIATIITGPFAGLILMYGNWRELFIIQGALPLVIGVGLWWYFAADNPDTARWIDQDEKDEIRALQIIDGNEKPVESDWRLAVRNPFTWYLAFLGMFVWLGFYGLQIWLPTLLKQSFHGSLTVGLVSAIPPVCAGIAIWFNGKGADRDQRYCTRVGIPLILGGIILALSSFVTADQRWLVVVALAAATACQLSFFAPYWTINSLLLPPAAVGAGFGIINGIGNLGGMLGPYLGGWLQDLTNGNMFATTVFFGVSVAVAGLMAFGLSGAVRAKIAEDRARQSAILKDQPTE
ncbi:MULTISPECIES: MFS transporter [Actinotignum]|uniref:MFS transporter n=1 Tax=Actinotignum TaxID=1653174 RepID=UPI000B352542|nr:MULTISPECIES: MFS transporter [Actinotignum]MBS5749212.1 MFS transporter [Actinotignum schaalii]MDE1558164.1 MFS transporter [Actinotignum schaalii]MDE1662802.1 MFS transporter [Actinotignum schaalii]MDK6372970.1 MFS transporter [Actinotignum timonense]MDK6419016.1 MFS transporter [Actinotignum timonense]